MRDLQERQRLAGMGRLDPLDRVAETKVRAVRGGDADSYLWFPSVEIARFPDRLQASSPILEFLWFDGEPELRKFAEKPGEVYQEFELALKESAAGDGADQLRLSLLALARKYGPLSGRVREYLLLGLDPAMFLDADYYLAEMASGNPLVIRWANGFATMSEPVIMELLDGLNEHLFSIARAIRMAEIRSCLHRTRSICGLHYDSTARGLAARLFPTIDASATISNEDERVVLPCSRNDDPLQVVSGWLRQVLDQGFEDHLSAKIQPDWRIRLAPDGAIGKSWLELSETLVGALEMGRCPACNKIWFATGKAVGKGKGTCSKRCTERLRGRRRRARINEEARTDGKS